MVYTPTNPTQMTPPRVSLIDERSGAISREWYRFFLSLLTATQTTQEETELVPDTTALLASYDAMLIDLAQGVQSAPDATSLTASLESSLNNLQDAFEVTPPDLGGTVTSVAASGGATGLTFTGSPITTSGTFTLGGTLAVASGGTGQVTYTNGELLIGNTTGNTLTKATLTAGTNVSITNGAGSITINATDAFVGTVTSVSVVSANGFAGTVANATTTPAITLSTSVTGLVKGNGTALLAAIAATDYVAPSAYASANGLVMSTNRLLGRTTASTGAAEEITVGTGLLLSGGTLSNSAPDQTVSLTSGTGISVSGTYPSFTITNTAPDQTVTLTAGTAISISGTYPSFTITNTAPDQIVSLTGAGTTVVTGTYPSFTITSNDQYVGTVTSVSGTGTVNGITLTGTVTSSGSLTLGGTLSNVDLTSQVTGTLPVGNGGTGATTFTANGVLYGNTTSAIGATAAGTTGQVLIGNTGAAPSWSALSSNAVTSISFGTTGLTPSTATQGAVTVAGTLAVGNGGTGATSLTSNYLIKGNGTSAVSSSIIQDNGTEVGVGAAPIGSFRFFVQGTGTTSATYAQVIRNSASTNLFFIQDDGKMFTGSAAASPYNNTTAAAANCVLGIVAGELLRSTSSIRYKTGVTDYSRGLADLNKLRPVFYKGKNDGDKVYAGLIAEEVDAVGMTEFVTYDEENRPDALAYPNMVALLVRSLQDVSARLEALELKYAT